MALNRQRRLANFVMRQARLRDVRPTVVQTGPVRKPPRVYRAPYFLLAVFILLILVGGLLLALPIASRDGQFTSLELSFFTATSAVTVTGLTVVNTSTYWSAFGQAVIFFLMLVGGLGFMAVATFILTLIGQRSTLAERMVMRDTMGVDQMEGLRRIAWYIIVVVFIIYALGAAAIFAHINGLDGMGVGESVWQSFFLAVSAFNNAGFSILPEIPEASGLARVATMETLLASLMVLIILGGIGWTTLLDVYRNRRFSRLSLDAKLVITTSLLLWILGAVAMFVAEFTNPRTLGALSMADTLINSIFHSVSGRTAGLSTLDFAEVQDFTKLMYPGLMFIGGAAGSVAGGIKVNTIAVIIVVVISSVRGRPQAEAFGREIAHVQVLRALTVAVLGIGFIAVILPTLTVTEGDIPFLNLLFDLVSAFGTTGLSTGIVPDLSLAGKALFMVTMVVGRLGPLSLALALAPREEASTYRFVQERVKIG